MVKDFWIYQERQNEGAQWAIYVVMDYTRGKPELTLLDFTIYSEDIDNKAHSKSFMGLHYPCVSDYVNYIVTQLCEFTSVHNKDMKQLEREITYILQS